MRRVTFQEQEILTSRGCYASSWEDIWVSEDFHPLQLMGCRFEGKVEIGSNTRIVNSYISNYTIGKGTTIEDVTRLECRAASTFGNGVRVATINENGGRSILIYDQLRAQCAYIWALYRHREEMVKILEEMVEEYSLSKLCTMGKVGDECLIIGARLIQECDIRDGVHIKGASLLENGTIERGTYIGVDVKAKDFITAEEALLDSGAIINRCFIGERAIIAAGFTAVDSLFFSSSHLENGEAVSIFAGPYTVSHHKSSLLIAGLFSFFNAGSGSNQSNHLFKEGAIHQAIHPRGCKFTSGAYVMSPAREGAFTMVKGHHSRHHDTWELPYSYLIDNGGRSLLIPGANLVSYGTQRDIEKWMARDQRTTRRDLINFEQHNPYITSAMVRAVNRLHTLSSQNEQADEFIFERTTIKRSHLKRGVGLYNKAIAASLGSMLSEGERDDKFHCSHEWGDIAGAYIPMSVVEGVITKIEQREFSLKDIDRAFTLFWDNYTNYAHYWAHSLLGELLGHTPSQEEVQEAIEAAKRSAQELERQILNDKSHDRDLSMSVGYGNDFEHQEGAREADFKSVMNI